MKIHNLNDLGTLIQRTRRIENLSGAELARKADKGQPFISRIEHGTENITIRTLIDIVKAFGKSVHISIK